MPSAYAFERTPLALRQALVRGGRHFERQVRRGQHIGVQRLIGVLRSPRRGPRASSWAENSLARRPSRAADMVRSVRSVTPLAFLLNHFGHDKEISPPARARFRERHPDQSPSVTLSSRILVATATTLVIGSTPSVSTSSSCSTQSRMPESSPSRRSASSCVSLDARELGNMAHRGLIDLHSRVP